MQSPIETFIDHYHKTFELTYDMWKQRNRTFLILIGVIGIATLLTFRVPEANSLLIDLIANALQVTDTNRINELRATFPFGLLQSILLIIVFYLMVNLYHRALYVLRNYQYLGALETEIRTTLNLPQESIFFTRESTFYWQDRSRILGSVKWFYILILGFLLLAFLGGRIIDDYLAGSLILALVETGIAIPIMIYFFAYARSSIGLDSASSMLRHHKPSTFEKGSETKPKAASKHAG